MLAHSLPRNSAGPLFLELLDRDAVLRKGHGGRIPHQGPGEKEFSNYPIKRNEPQIDGYDDQTINSLKSFAISGNLSRLRGALDSRNSPAES